jgi:hypothetical protein
MLVPLLAVWILPALAQQTVSSPANAPVPNLIQFSGVLRDETGKPMSSFVGVTFLLYKDEQGGAPLWLETQNVQPDKTGHYSVMLGATSSYGLPSDIFVAGEARWLTVQPQSQQEQPRVMLLSVPYALKAGDAQNSRGTAGLRLRAGRAQWQRCCSGRIDHREFSRLHQRIAVFESERHHARRHGERIAVVDNGDEHSELGPDAERLGIYGEDRYQHDDPGRDLRYEGDSEHSGPLHLAFNRDR